MTASDNTALLRDVLQSAEILGARLAASRDRVAPLFPITADTVGTLTEVEAEGLDAYLHRFSMLLITIQDHVFRGLGLVEGEDMQRLSNRDRANLMERLGAIPSAEQFAALAILRNRIAHLYPDRPDRQAARLNAVMAATDSLLANLGSVVSYAQRKGLTRP